MLWSSLHAELEHSTGRYARAPLGAALSSSLRFVGSATRKATEPEENLSTPPLAIRWRLAIRDHETLSPSTKLFGFTLSTYADNGTGQAHPSLSTLAGSCGYSVRTAYTAQKKLEAFGFLTIQRRVGLSSIFTLALPRQPTSEVPRQSATQTSATHCRVTHKNSGGRPPVGSAPPISEDECAGCGRRLPLVKDDLYCKGCAQ
jgi:hypothetical protein